MQLLGGRAAYKPVRLLVHRREQLAVYQVAQRQACHMSHRRVERPARQPAQRPGHSPARHATSPKMSPATGYVAQQVVRRTEDSSRQEGTC